MLLIIIIVRTDTRVDRRTRLDPVIDPTDGRTVAPFSVRARCGVVDLSRDPLRLGGDGFF